MLDQEFARGTIVETSSGTSSCLASAWSPFLLLEKTDALCPVLLPFSSFPGKASFRLVSSTESKGKKKDVFRRSQLLHEKLHRDAEQV